MNFSIRRTGNIGIEILDPNGWVIAWAIDELVGATLVHLLNGCERDDFITLRRNMKSIDQINRELLEAAISWKEENE